jgi:hypothetical protein
VFFIASAYSYRYAYYNLNDIWRALHALEANLVVGILGIAVYRAKVAWFFTGLSCALVAVTGSSLLNFAILEYLPKFGVQAYIVLNLLSVGVGLLFALRLCFAATRSITVLFSAILIHFLFLAILQRDQLGANFMPYRVDNPIQWLPTAVAFGAIAAVLAARSLGNWRSSARQPSR